MRIAARIEESDTTITHIVFIDDQELPVDLETWLKLAVSHCHDLRSRTILADEDRAAVQQMETE